ncbi:MAG TPA: FKBP-type peptidyl-prolyl cis-trans isomerase [Candidatus Polarisedimenticolia bacterium]|nr:FKBP-type peptidyl-prolyl cis-trans isomerase [Candidatus Polarisedimenticolia bacterium]
MRKLAMVAVLAGMAVLAGCKGSDATKTTGGNGQLLTEDDKTVYAMGVMLGGNVKSMSLTPEQIETMTRGFKDAALGKTPEVDPQSRAAQIQEFARGRATAAADAEKKKSADFLAQAEKESGAVKTESGIIIKTLTPGKGDSPKPTDTVKVHYTGKLTDGSVFDSSVQRGQPAEFALTGVIPCWTQGLQKMKVGEKAQLVCPSDVAYGDQGRPPRIPGGATLVFEVELLEIKK